MLWVLSLALDTCQVTSSSLQWKNCRSQCAHHWSCAPWSESRGNWGTQLRLYDRKRPKKDSNSGFCSPRAACPPCQAAPCRTHGVMAGMGSCLLFYFAPSGAVLSSRAGAVREGDSLVSLSFNTEAWFSSCFWWDLSLDSKFLRVKSVRLHMDRGHHPPTH